jgi:hypothetical protein
MEKAFNFLYQAFRRHIILEEPSFSLDGTGVYYLQHSPHLGVWLFLGGNPEGAVPSLVVGGQRVKLQQRQRMGGEILLTQEVDLGFARIKPFIIRHIDIATKTWKDILKASIELAGKEIPKAITLTDIPLENLEYLDYLFSGRKTFLNKLEVPKANKDYGKWISVRVKPPFRIVIYIVDDATQGIAILSRQKVFLNTYFSRGALEHWLLDPDYFFIRLKQVPKTAPDLSELVLKHFEPALLV